jgi:hypothetical protein
MMIADCGLRICSIRNPQSMIPRPSIYPQKYDIRKFGEMQNAESQLLDLLKEKVCKCSVFFVTLLWSINCF